VTEHVLELSDISKSFPGVNVLNGVNFALRAGEIHALLGENGAGKSTLVNLIGGVFPPDAGEIRIMGRPVHLKGPHDSIRNGISIIHQELSLVPDLSVAENIFLGRFPDGWVNWRKLHRQAEEILERIGLSIHPGTPVRYLSTGKQQLVEIARAIAFHPRILIMDEPTSALTEYEVQTLFGIIRRLSSEGLAVIYITHHMDEVWELSHKVTVLRDGRVIFTKDIEECTPHDIAEAMLGHKLAGERKRRLMTGDTVLEVRNLSAKGRFRDVNIRIAGGEIVGIAGQLGAGKTELIRAIYGADPFDAGEIIVAGETVKFGSPRDSILRGMYMVPENRKSGGLVLDMNVGENMTLPYLDKISRLGFLSQKKQHEIVDSYIRKLNIKTTGADKKIRYLSGGNQQKVILSRWIGMNPRILLLDQPTRGIDIGSKEEIYEIMHQLAESGVGILFVATETHELLRVCDRIYVMRDGMIVREFHGEECTEKDLALAMLGEKGA